MLSFAGLALVGFVVALVVALVLTPGVRRLAFKRGWVDQPDGERKLHKQPTPAVGGVAIFAGAVAGFTAVTLGAPLAGVGGVELPMVVVLGALAMVGVGLWDDLRGLGFKTKLAVEVVVAYALLLSDSSFLLDLTAVPYIGGDPYTHALFAIPITLAWIVGVMNAINLIDGIDGLAAGVGIIALASLAAAFGVEGNAVLLLIAVVMIGSLLGFLKHNFNPASIFMGDSGSLFVGFVLAVFTLSGTGHANPLVALAIPILALGLPIFDTVLSMVRRAIGRQAICAPDRDHIHHRMTEKRSVRSAVISLYVVAGAFGLIAVAMSVTPASATPWLIGLAILGAAAFATTLGYVRRPYTPPALIEATASPANNAVASPGALQVASSLDATEMTERAGESGDGTIVAPQMEPMRGFFLRFSGRPRCAAGLAFDLVT
ncbi:MAG: MraY family glycosyltransferase [Bacteroidota bacterium]